MIIAVARVFCATVAVVVLGAFLVPLDVHAAPDVAETEAAGTEDGTVAFIRGRQVWAVAPDGGELRRLTTSGRHFGPAVSPDGTKVAFARRVAGGHDLFVMNFDGSHRFRLTRGGVATDGGPAWSPDGSQLAFGGACVPTAEDPDLCAGDDVVLDVVGVDGSPPRTLLGCFEELSCERLHPVESVLGQPAWSPTGQAIAYYSDHNPTPADTAMLAYDVTTGRLRLLDTIGGACCGWGHFAAPAFSADGTRFAYERYEPGFEDPPVYLGIQQCAYPEMTPCRLFAQVDGDHELDYAPAGDRVVLRNSERRRLLLADPDGTNRVVLTRGADPSWG